MESAGYQKPKPPQSALSISQICSMLHALKKLHMFRYLLLNFPGKG